MNDEDPAELIDRLDLLIGIMQLAHSEQIEAARSSYRSDPVIQSLLDGSEDWVGAGELIAKTMGETSAAKRTVQRRISDLIGRRALRTRGSGPSISYRNTGLI